MPKWLRLLVAILKRQEYLKVPWNGSAPSQTFGRTDGISTGDDTWQQAAAAPRNIEPDDHDVHDTDIKDGINACLKKDGGNTATANIPMGGFTLTNIANASARTSPASFAQIQDNKGQYVATVGGTADVITLTPSPAITAYAAGQRFTFIASGANTGATTVNVSGVGAKDVKRNDGSATALSAGDIASGAIVDIEYDGTNFLLLGRQTNFQPLDSDLTAIAALSTTAAGRTALTYADPGADRVLFWDDSESALASLSLSGLTISTTTLAVDAASDIAAGKIELAVQSEMETATDVARAVTPGRMHFHPGIAKFWAYATVAAGTPTLQTSYNVTSIADTAVGVLTVTIATDFSSANWAPQLTVVSDGSDQIFPQIGSGGVAAGSVVAESYAGTGTADDPAAWSVSGLGDHA
jgi:hypothetical protein